MTLELNKYRLRKLFNYFDDDDLPADEAQQLWEDTNNGFSLSSLYLARALTFDSFQPSAQCRVLDINYAYKKEKFDLMEPLMGAIIAKHEEGTPIDDAFIKEFMTYIETNAKKFKDAMKITAKSKEPVKSIKAILEQATFFSLKVTRAQVAGKRTRKYHIAIRYPAGYASLQTKHDFNTGAHLLDIPVRKVSVS